MGVYELLRQRSYRKDPGMIRQIAVVGKDIVKNYGSAKRPAQAPGCGVGHIRWLLKYPESWSFSMQMKGIGTAESGRGAGVTSSISEEQRKAIEAHFGFDQPFYLRYWKWLVTDRLGMRMESYKLPQQNHPAVDQGTI